MIRSITGLTAAAVVVASAGLLWAGKASSQAKAASCTSQWLAQRNKLPVQQRFDRKRADTFGRRCLGVTGPKPVDWGQVKRQLEALITADYPLNAIVPADIDRFCPGYVHASVEQRRDFWREFALQVIKPEAGNNSNAIMWEQPRPNGQPVGGEYSIGLLQLSLSNRHPYECDIPDEASLLDPERNLSCGTKILSYLVSKGRIGGDAGHGRDGAARYWSTLRIGSEKPNASGHNETRQPLIAKLRALPQCSG